MHEKGGAASKQKNTKAKSRLVLSAVDSTRAAPNSSNTLAVAPVKEPKATKSGSERAVDFDPITTIGDIFYVQEKAGTSR